MRSDSTRLFDSEIENKKKKQQHKHPMESK